MKLSSEAITKAMKTICEIIEQSKKNQQFNANILDRIHASENDHSKILVMLLSYKQNDKFTFLESFLERVGIPNDVLDTPLICFNHDNIDVSIQFNDVSVIIENKIGWAVDQPRQIERYVNTMIEKGYDQKKIYVIYLTDDGRKKVSPESLTEECKKKLDERFFSVDYKHLILPWLKTEVFPNIPNKDVLLSAAVYQYIDYLEGRFGIRERDYKKEREKMDKIKDFLVKELKLNENDNIGFVKGIDDFLRSFDDEVARIRNEHDLSFILRSAVFPKLKDYCSVLDKESRFWRKVWIWQKDTFVLELNETTENSPINEKNMYLDTYLENNGDQYFLTFSLGRRKSEEGYDFNEKTKNYVTSLNGSWFYDNQCFQKRISWDKRYSKLPRMNDNDGENNLVSEIFTEIKKGLLDELGIHFQK